MNDNGGINGRPIQYIQYTEQLNPTHEAALAHKLVESDKVVGIVGNTSFAECGTNWKYYKSKGFIVIGAGVQAECFDAVLRRVEHGAALQQHGRRPVPARARREVDRHRLARHDLAVRRRLPAEDGQAAPGSRTRSSRRCCRSPTPTPTLHLVSRRPATAAASSSTSRPTRRPRSCRRRSRRASSTRSSGARRRRSPTRPWRGSSRSSTTRSSSTRSSEPHRRGPDETLYRQVNTKYAPKIALQAFGQMGYMDAKFATMALLSIKGADHRGVVQRGGEGAQEREDRHALQAVLRRQHPLPHPEQRRHHRHLQRRQGRRRSSKASRRTSTRRSPRRAPGRRSTSWTATRTEAGRDRQKTQIRASVVAMHSIVALRGVRRRVAVPQAVHRVRPCARRGVCALRGRHRRAVPDDRRAEPRVRRRRCRGRPDRVLDDQPHELARTGSPTSTCVAFGGVVNLALRVRVRPRLREAGSAREDDGDARPGADPARDHGLAGSGGRGVRALPDAPTSTHRYDDLRREREPHADPRARVRDRRSPSATTVFLRCTSLGTAYRAVANDREITATLGVPVRRVEASAWFGSGLVCGVAGLLLADLYTSLDYSALTFLVISSLAAALIGRLRVALGDARRRAHGRARPGGPDAVRVGDRVPGGDAVRALDHRPALALAQARRRHLADDAVSRMDAARRARAGRGAAPRWPSSRRRSSAGS